MPHHFTVLNISSHTSQIYIAVNHSRQHIPAKRNIQNRTNLKKYTHYRPKIPQNHIAVQHTTEQHKVPHYIPAHHIALNYCPELFTKSLPKEFYYSDTTSNFTQQNTLSQPSEKDITACHIVAEQSTTHESRIYHVHHCTIHHSIYSTEHTTTQNLNISNIVQYTTFVNTPQ